MMTIDGAIDYGSNGVLEALGIIAWRYSFDDNNQLSVSTPTWFSFSDQAELKIGLNNHGWMALSNGIQAQRYRLEWDGVEDMFTLVGGEGNLFDSNVQWSRAGGINQAGDAAAFLRKTNSNNDELVAKRLNGTLLNFPAYTTKRDEVNRIESVWAINDATSTHAVQVLGKVGVSNTRNGSYQSPRPALWEAGGTVRLLQDITSYPSDATYSFPILGTSMYDLNDASWICGQTQRRADGEIVNIPTVLIRN